MKSIAMFLVCALVSAPADAAIRRWIANGGTASWNVGANWSGGVVPGADQVIFDGLNGNGTAICQIDVSTSDIVSFTMTSGTVTFTASGTLNIAGNFDLAGGTFTAASGKVAFVGTTFANYTNTTGAAFNNVTLFKTVGASLTLLNDMTVNGTLTLTQQNMYIGNNNLTLNGTLVGGSNNSWIITNGSGFFKRAGVGGGTNFSFPVGTEAVSFNPVTINNSGTTDMFSVRVQIGFGGLASPPVDPTVVVNRIWFIEETTPGGSNAALAFQYNSFEINPASFDVTNNYISRYNGTGWVPTAATENSPIGGPYISSASGFTAFSPFGITSDLNTLPIQLGSFTAGVTQNNLVRLNWTTISEVNNYGFYIQKRPVQATEWTEIANSFVPGHGTTNVPQHYSYTDNTPLVSATQYRLRQVDLDGTEHLTEYVQVSGPTGVTEVAPLQFALSQNYPNPFNPSTEIKFSVDATAPASLEVFNALGQRVATLYNEIAIAGQNYKVRFDAGSFATGVYYYRLQSDNKVDMKKLMLIK